MNYEHFKVKILFLLKFVVNRQGSFYLYLISKIEILALNIVTIEFLPLVY